jgi:hypothetical protein
MFHLQREQREEYLNAAFCLLQNEMIIDVQRDVQRERESVCVRLRDSETRASGAALEVLKGFAEVWKAKSKKSKNNRKRLYLN